jgi:DNA-directed RNA polymerase subunit F
VQANKMSEGEKDEHGCLIGKEQWNEEQQKCIPKQTTNDSGKEIKNKTVKFSIEEALAMIPPLEAKIKEKNNLIADLTRQLDEANKVLEAQERAKLVNDIIPMSSYKINDLVPKSIEELKAIRLTLSAAMPPRINSVAFGVLGSASDDRERGLTVGDLSVVTAAKRKSA